MAGTRRNNQEAPHRLILDSGAINGLTRGDQRARAFLARAMELDALIEIPVVVSPKRFEVARGTLQSIESSSP